MHNKSLIINCHFSEEYIEIPVFVVKLEDGFKEKIKDYKTSIELLRELHANNSISRLPESLSYLVMTFSLSFILNFKLIIYNSYMIIKVSIKAIF